LSHGNIITHFSLHLFEQFPESRAIAKYVLRKYSKPAQVDLLREGNPEEAAMVDVWTEVEAHTYLPAIAPIFYECVVYPAEHGTSPNQKVVEESLEKLKKVLDVYEAHLSKSMHLYLAGDFFSLADLNHVPYTFHIIRTPHASLFDDDPGSAVAQEAQPRYGDQRLIAKFDDDPGSGCGWGLYALPSFLPDPRIERLVQEL
jgi:glutathione S-transferase